MRPTSSIIRPSSSSLMSPLFLRLSFAVICFLTLQNPNNDPTLLQVTAFSPPNYPLYTTHNSMGRIKRQHSQHEDVTETAGVLERRRRRSRWMDSSSSTTTSLSSSLRSAPQGFIGDDDDNDDNDDDDDYDDDNSDEEVVFLVLGDDDTDLFQEVVAAYDDDDNDDEEDHDDDQVDPYMQVASSEFQNVKSGTKEEDTQRRSSSALTINNKSLDTTGVDWGGALSRLRERVEDVESGKSKDPSHVLFRMMSAQTPNQVIGQFVSSANPQVVQAMSGAIASLLGGLSNPNMGVETIVKASGEKIGSLCFQLQMTGYMFRNAEYVIALKDLMNLKGRRLTLDDYRDAFHRLDADKSGYIEVSEIQNLFKNVYDDGNVPSIEVTAFLEFFDKNKDGKISWDEFEKGLGAALATAQSSKGDVASRLLGYDSADNDDDDDDDDVIDVNTNVSGTIQIEMEDGKVVDVDAREYMENLKEEARKLKDALRKEHQMLSGGDGRNDPSSGLLPNSGGGADIAGYIASRQGDVRSLTEGISPEVVDTMKKLVAFVLEGGDKTKSSKNSNGSGLTDKEKAEMEMEIPGSALQQLALWQLVLGYRLREEEVKGDYTKLLKA